MTDIKEDTIRSVKWSAIEKFSVQIIQFILGIIMARILLPSDYGTVGMIAIFIAVSQTFIDSGFSSALIRKLDRTEADFSTVFYFGISVSLLLYVILFILSPSIASFFEMPILCPILRVQSISLVIGALMSVHNAKLTIALDFKTIAKQSTISTIASGVIALICAYCGLGVWSLVIQTVLGQLFNMVYVWIYLKWRPAFSFSFESFKDLGSFGSKLLASSLLQTISSNLTTFVIGKFFSAKDLGYYNRGTQFATLPVNTMNGILGKVLYPILSKIQNDDAQLVNAYRKYICVMSIPIFFCCTLLISVAKPLILLLLTETWYDSILYLQIFSLTIMFDHVSSINLDLLKVKGRSDLFLKLEIIKKTISLIMLLSAIPFGIIGICISGVIYSQVAIVVNTYYTGKLFNLGYVAQFKDFMTYFIKSVISCTLGYVLCTFTNLPNILSLVSASVMACLIYMILLRKDRHAIQIVEILKNMIGLHKV